MRTTYVVWRDGGRSYTGGRTKREFTARAEAIRFAEKHIDKNPTVDAIDVTEIWNFRTGDQFAARERYATEGIIDGNNAGGRS